MQTLGIRRWENTRRFTEYRLLDILPVDGEFKGSSVVLLDIDEGDVSGEFGILVLAHSDIVRRALRNCTATICAVCPASNATIGGRPGLLAWIECQGGELVGVKPIYEAPGRTDRPILLH